MLANINPSLVQVAVFNVRSSMYDRYENSKYSSFSTPIGLVIEIETELYSIHSYLIVYITLTDTTPQQFVPVPNQDLDF